MKNLYAMALVAMASTFAWAQVDSLNIIKLGHKDYQYNLSDIWGYADNNGLEYALFGTMGAFKVVDVSNPPNLVEKISIPGAQSLWRDVKSWSHYAYVCHDFQHSWSNNPDEGITIVDLDSLQKPRYKRFKPTFTVSSGVEDTLSTAHNIFIDENGILYVFGASGSAGAPIFAGGALMFDLSQDPWNPSYVGKFDQYYFHDGFARNDTLWAGAINMGFLSIVDVSNKSNPIVLATQTTPNQFTHNVWLSDDGKTVFTTDEKPDAFVAAYDVSDLNNISALDKKGAFPGTSVIPHNVFTHGDFVVVSYYTRGAYVLDAKYPDLLVEVGYYDTSPNFSGQGYNGAWGAYPYLPSGNLLISDIEEGLYVLGVEYKNASRVFGRVKDSLTGNTIANADVQFSVQPTNLTSSFDGTFKVGFPDSGWDTVTVSKLGYQTQNVAIHFTAGIYDTLNIAMLPNNFNVDEETGVVFNLYPNPAHEFFEINLSGFATVHSIELNIIGLDGKLHLNKKIIGSSSTTVHHGLPAGVYITQLVVNGRSSFSKLIIQ